MCKRRHGRRFGNWKTILRSVGVVKHIPSNVIGEASSAQHNCKREAKAEEGGRSRRQHLRHTKRGSTESSVCQTERARQTSYPNNRTSATCDQVLTSRECSRSKDCPRILSAPCMPCQTITTHELHHSSSSCIFQSIWNISTYKCKGDREISNPCFDTFTVLQSKQKNAIDDGMQVPKTKRE